MSKVEDFVKLITDAVNYDNVAFPTMRLSNDLKTIWIIYPPIDKDGNRSRVSPNLIKTLIFASESFALEPDLPITFEIFINEGYLTIEVKLKEG
jgi:hypothetical protein